MITIIPPILGVTGANTQGVAKRPHIAEVGFGVRVPTWLNIGAARYNIQQSIDIGADQTLNSGSYK